MLVRIMAITVLLLQGAAASAQAAPLSVVSDPSARLAGIDPVIDQALRQWDVPGASVAVVADGKVVLAKGYGVRDPRTRLPMNADTLLPTASLTKAFTAVTIGTLADQRKISFDAPVYTYLPHFRLSDPVSSQEITARDLLSHRSGLAGKNDYIYFRHPTMTAAGLLERLPFLALSGRPGRNYEYSNAAYVILGQVIERASGVPYERLVRRQLLEPLGMHRTTFSSAAAERDSNHAVGRWRWRGQDVHEFVPFTSIINPHGGIVSTANDMAKWMLMNLGGGSFEGRRIVNSSTLAEIQKTQIASPLDDGPGVVPLGYAMGWNSLVYRGEPTLLHTGGMQGWRTITILVPRKKAGVTLMINSDAGVTYPLAFQIIDRFFDGPPTDWMSLLKPPAAVPQGAQAAPPPPGPASSHQPADFSGTFRHAGFGTFRVRRAGAALVGEYSGHSAPLVHRYHNVFGADPSAHTNPIVGRVQFHDDIEGRVSFLTFEPFGDSRFERQPDDRLTDPIYLRRLAGLYESDNVRFSITVSGDKLVYQRDDLEPAILVPTVEGDFLHPRGNGLRISFQLPSSGPASAMVRREVSGVTEIPRRAGPLPRER